MIRNQFQVKTIVFLLVFAMGLTGCLSIEQQLRQRYVGTHKNQLLARWGPPDHKEPDGKGGEIWIYSRVKTRTTPMRREAEVADNEDSADNSKKEKTIVIYPSQVRRTLYNKSFFIGTDGVIYDTAYGWREL